MAASAPADVPAEATQLAVTMAVDNSYWQSLQDLAHMAGDSPEDAAMVMNAPAALRQRHAILRTSHRYLASRGSDSEEALRYRHVRCKILESKLKVHTVGAEERVVAKMAIESMERAMRAEAEARRQFQMSGELRRRSSLPPDGVGMHVVQRFRGTRDRITGVKFAPKQHDLFAFSSSDGTIRVCSASQKRIVARLRGHAGHVTDFDWSPSSSVLLSVSDDRTMRVWSIPKFEAPDAPAAPQPSAEEGAMDEDAPDGGDATTFSAESTDNDPNLIEIDAARVEKTSQSYACARFCPSNENVILVVVNSAGAATIHVINSSNGTIMQDQRLPSPITCMEFSNNGMLLFVGDTKGCVHSFKVSLTESSTQKRSILSNHKVLLGNQKNLMLSLGEQVLEETRRNIPLPAVPVPGMLAAPFKKSNAALTVQSISFQPFDTVLKSPALVMLDSHQHVRLFQMKAGEDSGFRDFEPGITETYASCAGSQECDLIVAGGIDGIVYLLDPHVNNSAPPVVAKYVCHLSAVSSVCWSFDEVMLLSGDDAGCVVLWEKTTKNDTLDQEDNHHHATETREADADDSHITEIAAARNAAKQHAQVLERLRQEATGETKKPTVQASAGPRKSTKRAAVSDALSVHSELASSDATACPVCRRLIPSATLLAHVEACMASETAESYAAGSVDGDREADTSTPSSFGTAASGAAGGPAPHVEHFTGDRRREPSVTSTPPRIPSVSKLPGMPGLPGVHMPHVNVAKLPGQAAAGAVMGLKIATKPLAVGARFTKGLVNAVKK